MTAAAAFNVRRWTANERLDEIMAMVHAAFAELEPPSGALNETAADLVTRLRDGFILVAQDGERFIGSLFCACQDDALYLTRLATVAERRKRGVGHALIATAEREARALGLAKLTLRVRETLPGNLAYFRKLGFAVTGKGQEAGRTPFYTMERRLA